MLYIFWWYAQNKLKYKIHISNLSFWYHIGPGNLHLLFLCLFVGCFIFFYMQWILRYDKAAYLQLFLNSSSGLSSNLCRPRGLAILWINALNIQFYKVNIDLIILSYTFFWLLLIDSMSRWFDELNSINF